MVISTSPRLSRYSKSHRRGSSGLLEGHTWLFTAEPRWVCSHNEEGLAAILKNILTLAIKIRYNSFKINILASLCQLTD